MSALKILVLGGTSWVGGAVASCALARGHGVVCLARGESGSVPDGAAHVRADRWDSSAYDQVADQDWDAVLDVSWQPDLVRSALSSLASRTRHWIYVSSVSVYADHSTSGADESAELVEPRIGAGEVAREEYAGAKVSCETSCREGVDADRLLVARPGLIVGYGDRSDRFGYWPARFALASDGDEVLVPPLAFGVQVIDVADLARWLVLAAEERAAGTFDAIGEPTTFAEVARECTSVADVTPTLVAPDEEWLTAQSVEPWMGPESLPLWVPSSSYGGMVARSGRAARTAGLSTSPLRDSVESSFRWERELGLTRPRTAGLTSARESELLERWAASGA